MSFRTRTYVDTRASLIDLEKTYNGDKMVFGLIIAHVTYAVTATVAFILLLMLSLGPITFYRMGADEAEGQPLPLFIPTFIFLFLFVIISIVAVFSLKYRNMQLLQTQIASNFIIGISLTVCGLLTYLLLKNISFHTIYDSWIDGYGSWFVDLSIERPDDWEEMQNTLECCGSNAESLLQVDFSQLSGLLNGNLCGTLSFNSVLIDLILDFKNESKLNGDFETELGKNFEINFCVDKIVKILDKTGVPVLFFTFGTLIFVIFTTYYLTKLIRDLFILQELKKLEREERQEKKKKENKDLSPELMNIYCESFKMNTWKNSIKSSKEILTKYAGSFSKLEERDASRHLETVSIHEDRNKPKKIKLSVYEVEKKQRTIKRNRFGVTAPVIEVDVPQVNDEATL